jgi:hypothetical protein
MKRLLTILAALSWTYLAQAEPNLIGHWVSDRDTSASFNEQRAQLEERTADFLRQLYGRLTVTFAAGSVAWRMPGLEVTVEGERRELAGFVESHPYEVLGSTQDTVAIRTREPVSGTEVIYLYTFEGPDKMWVYVGKQGLHLREYFVRAREG